ncbi:hypothetical protein HLB44_30820 [Aquincola sp. S2]|uniref:Uncharacterized protein n=1 Tax=Pseudaquabacterium terrae TaxID=2732868 RepID=A0ABX2ERN1_9BURK|nr:hypothetical protein [Aquabacterium terrae]NRF71387.1 hypothetical protein [Aquabacterium terrae]
MNAVPAYAVAPIDPIKPDPEITAEIVIEMIAAVCANLHRIERESADNEVKSRAAALYEQTRARRFSFDPHDAAEVDAMLESVSAIAEAVEAGRLP